MYGWGMGIRRARSEMKIRGWVMTAGSGQCIMKKRPASEGRGCDGRRLRCAVQGFAPLRRRFPQSVFPVIDRSQHPVRNRSASLPASTLSLLLPPLTRHCAADYTPQYAAPAAAAGHTAEPPRCLLPRSHAARPVDHGETAECCWLWFRSPTPSPASRSHSGRRSRWLPCARPFRYI